MEGLPVLGILNSRVCHDEPKPDASIPMIHNGVRARRSALAPVRSAALACAAHRGIPAGLGAKRQTATLRAGRPGGSPVGSRLFRNFSAILMLESPRTVMNGLTRS